MGGEWHCMTARSCSARAGVKRIYIRMPDSRTKASTCFAAAVLRRISGVEKYIPRSSTACFRRRRASVNLGQTSITCSAVSGISHWSQRPSGWRPMRDVWWFSWQWHVHKRKIIVEREWVAREDRSRAGKITLYVVPLVSVCYWISYAWKECWYRYGSISVKFNRVFTRLLSTHLGGLGDGLAVRVLPSDQKFHFLGCFGGPEHKGNGHCIPMQRVWNRGGEFYLRNYAFSSSN